MLGMILVAWTHSTHSSLLAIVPNQCIICKSVSTVVLIFHLSIWLALHQDKLNFFVWQMPAAVILALDAARMLLTFASTRHGSHTTTGLQLH